MAALGARHADVDVQPVHALAPRRAPDALDHREVSVLLYHGQRLERCGRVSAGGRDDEPIRAGDPVGGAAQLVQGCDRLVVVCVHPKYSVQTCVSKHILDALAGHALPGEPRGGSLPREPRWPFLAEGSQSLRVVGGSAGVK